MSEPRALTLGEIPAVVEEYRSAASLAMDAGFDGVELHCTSGYLPAQFLSTGTNQRKDAYGGSLQNRLRFTLEVLDAMVEVAGAGRVGMRICPGNPFNGLSDDNPVETFSSLLQAVNPLGLAYLHVIRMPALGIDNIALARENFQGPIIVNESYTPEEAAALLAEDDRISAVSFGRPFIANPDFVERVRDGQRMSDVDFKTLYSPGPEGYTDYPVASHRG